MWLELRQFSKTYRREREKFYRFGHADVNKIRKRRAIRALHVILVPRLGAVLKLSVAR